MRGGWGWNPPGPSRMRTPSARRASTLRRKGVAAGQRGVDEGQDHDRDVQAGSLGEDAEGVGVADAQGPFVDRVVGGRGDDDRVGYLGPGRAGLAVLAADGAARLFLDGGLVEEAEGGGGGDDLDCPAAFLGELNEGADGGGRACAAHDDGQDAPAGVLGHRVMPIWLANCSASRRMLGGAEVMRSRTRRWTDGRPVTSSGAISSAARRAM